MDCIEFVSLEFVSYPVLNISLAAISHGDISECIVQAIADLGVAIKAKVMAHK